MKLIVLQRRSCRAVKLAAILAGVLALAACAIPRSGPSASDFNHASADQLIDLKEATMGDALATRSAPASSEFDAGWRAAEPLRGGIIGAGDVVAVSFFERDGLNLFTSDTTGNVRLDGLTVSPEGAIQLPYVGQVHVAGLTLAQARAAVVRRLSSLTFGTDVTVTVSEHQSELVTVQGAVAKPGPVPIGPGSDRLLGLLSAAGPNPADLDVAKVTVRRDGESRTIPLAALYDHPEDNIALRPGDIIIVRAATGAINVLGAAGLQGRVKITRDNYSLVDAIADARGLDDAAADPAAVYVMRLSENRDSPGVPRVYHFNLRNPAQLAVASSFYLHDGDAVMISNARFTQYHKVLSTFTGVLNSARTASTVVP